jgi:hypothetical protein
VTLQGLGGLKIARNLERIGDLWGVDVDPAAYRNRPAKPSNQLTLPGVEVAPFDWVGMQADLGVPVVRTAGGRIRVGDVDRLREELDTEYPVEVSTVLALDAGWLGLKHVDALEQELKAADRDVSLVFAAAFNPLEGRRRIEGLRRLLRWAGDAQRKLELLRTDLSGLPAVMEGAAVAAIGLSTSGRHLGTPMGARNGAAYDRRKRSPLVFVPRLLHWQRANVLGELAPWNGAGVTHCDCQHCAGHKHDLQRFDAAHDQVKTQVREHDELALSTVIREIMSADDPKSELKFRRINAAQRGKSIGSSLDVKLDPPPAWLDAWD